MLLIFSVSDNRPHFCDEPVSEPSVCGQVPALVVAQMDDLRLKLRDLVAV